MDDSAASSAQQDSMNGQQVIVKACDVCRKKKIRCEPTKEGCVQCSKFKTVCHFTPISTKRRPRRPAGFRYIAGLEERLKKMEGLLDNTANTHEADQQAKNDFSPFGVLNLESHSPPSQAIPKPQNLLTATANPPGKGTTIPNNKYVASILSWSFEQSDMAWKSMVLGDEQSDAPACPLASWKGPLAFMPFSLSTFQALPPTPTALELVNDAFASFNSFFPLFDEQEFLQQFHTSYLGSTPTDPGWWACINVVFALAHRFRSMRTLEAGTENDRSCGYIHNALAVISELSVLHQSLPAIQALVGMAVILQGTSHPQPASVLIAAAIRLAQAMGLHRKIEDPTLSDAQIEQRKRVFWMAYFLDKDISLRMGQPFAQDDDDMDAELPTGTLYEMPLCNQGPQTINFFNSRIGLAVIQGQIYKRLYSVQASRQSVVQKASVAQELNSILSYWRNSVPIDLEDVPEAPFRPPLSEKFIHMLIIRFTYVNCLVMIDRHLPPTTQDPLDTAFDMQFALAPPERPCIVESRRAINLIQMTPPGDYACVWILLHPFFAAVTVLLNNVVQFPATPQAASDLHIVEPFIHLVEALAAQERTCSRSEEARSMRDSCQDLYAAAKQSVTQAQLSITFG